MATYDEIRNLFTNSTLRNRVSVACIVSAWAIKLEDIATTNHDNRMIWARKTFENPDGVSLAMLMALLAANKDATVAAITGASSETIQALVDSAVDVFADGS